MEALSRRMQRVEEQVAQLSVIRTAKVGRTHVDAAGFSCTGLDDMGTRPLLTWQTSEVVVPGKGQINLEVRVRTRDRHALLVSSREPD